MEDSMPKRIANLLVPMLLVSLAFAGSAWGQTPLERYRAESFQLRIDWQQPVLMRAGAEADLGFFGQNGDALFALSPEALESIDTYQTMRTVGFTFWAIGLTTLSAMIVMLLVDDEIFIDKSGGTDALKPLFWGLLIGGGVTGMGGALVMTGANSHLSDAVGHHNDDLNGRLGGSAAFTPRITVTTQF
ncbi:MAG: H+/gluconate symporter-like permease [Myxococcota bacterium]|jgi:H+/gluconate symporter-like permease